MIGKGSDRGWVVLLGLALWLGGCTSTEFVVHTAKRVSQIQDSGPTETYKVGNPYQIKGNWYYPAEDYDYDETGIASWYGPQFHGQKTANGEVFDMNQLSAAHTTLPMPSFVRVTNLDNGRSMILRINDRGPFASGRIIDLSRRAAQLLGYEAQGTARVRIQVLADESRAVAMRLKGGTQIAQADSPIVVSKLPRAQVSGEVLPPVDGAKVSTSSISVGLPQPTPPPVAEPAVASLATPETGTVALQPVRSTNLFVQAGAFAFSDNAERVRTILGRLGNVRVSAIRVDGRDLFRVRLGPLTDVGQADDALAKVVAAGYPGARIIVE